MSNNPYAAMNPYLPGGTIDEASAAYALAHPDQPLHTDVYGQHFYPNVKNPSGPWIEDPTTLHAGKYLLTSTINRVIMLLVKAINSMQSVAVQQANRLTFLTQWQKAYTSQMNSVHTFTQLNGDAYVAGTDSTSSTDRQSLNQTNSTYVQSMQSNNNIISDTAKSLQTNINQTQDAVNQQSNMVTSLLSQMQTIIQLISNAK